MGALTMTIKTDTAAKLFGCSVRKVQDMCKSGALYAYKDKQGNSVIEPWTIELGSLAYFLRYDKDAKEAFDKGDDSVLKRKVNEFFNRIESSEKKTYSFQETCTILGLSKSELFKKCFKGEFGRRRLLTRSLTLTDILLYIKATPGAEEKLQERYENALMNGDGRLFLYREVATAYAYFKQYGYAI